MGRRRKSQQFVKDPWETSDQRITFDSDEEEAQDKQTETKRVQQSSSFSQSNESVKFREHTQKRDRKSKEFHIKTPHLEERRKQLLDFRKQLPIYSTKETILHELESNPSVIIIGETGSGKTTQVGQFLYEHFGASKGTIAITQPRRLAAKTTASRVADEIGSEIGGIVGYNVRFDNKTSDRTKIKFLTDGMLLRECMVDPDLKNYYCVIIDEAHERSINSDILCGLVRSVQERRKDFKIVIMSATLEAELFENYFKAKVLYVKGRQYPVEVLYTNVAQRQWIDSMISTVFMIHLQESPGDILAFLTGKEEIEDVARVLNEKSRLLPPECPKLIVCPLYAAQSSDQQAEAFEITPQDCRKIVLATNIAETSITVPNIRYVVDCGLVKQKQRASRQAIINSSSFSSLHKSDALSQHQRQKSSSKADSSDKNTSAQHSTSKSSNTAAGHVDILALVTISKAQAWQRAGRAGRTQPGKAYRLYTEKFFVESMPESQVAEIKRVELTNVLLQMLNVGIEDIQSFPWLDPPEKSMIRQALRTLLVHGAIDNNMKISPLGRRMSMFPLDPKYSKTLIHSLKFECVHHVLTIIAMLETENIFYTPSGASRYSGTIDATNQEQVSETSSTTIDRQGYAQLDLARKSFLSHFGDHIFLLNVYHSYHQEPEKQRKKWASNHFINWRSLEQARDIRTQLETYWRNASLPLDDEILSIIQLKNTSSNEWIELCNRIAKSFIMGFFEQVAIRKENGVYQTLLDSQPVAIHPASTMFDSKPECVIFNELVFTTNFYIRDVLCIQRLWLEELVPQFSANEGKQPALSDSKPSSS